MLVPQEVDELFDNLRELKARGPDHHLHLAQARRGARGRRRDHRDPARHHGRDRASPSERHRPPARRADGRQRAADARRPASRPSPTRSVLAVAGLTVGRRRTAARCSTTSSFDDPPRRGARHRRRRGQRPGRAGRGDHGHAAARARARSCSAAPTSPPGRPGGAARPASATSPRTGTGTACCSTRRCGRTGSSATRPRRRTSNGLLDRPGRRPARTPSGSSTQYDVRTPGIDVARRRRCPAATSRSSSSAGR